MMNIREERKIKENFFDALYSQHWKMIRKYNYDRVRVNMLSFDDGCNRLKKWRR